MNSAVATRGTLLVLVPSNDGLVFAADSRSTIRSVHCDDRRKITLLQSPFAAALSVTGTGTILPARSKGIPLTAICDYIEKTKPIFDINSQVKKLVEEKGTDIDQISLDEIGEACASLVVESAESIAESLQEFASREMFQVVLAQQKNGAALIRSVAIKISADRRSATWLTKSDYTFLSSGIRDYAMFGETDYVNKHVFNGGIGKQFLARSLIDFLERDARKVEEIGSAEASQVAVDLISAASKTTALVSSPSGIGGPIHAFLLSTTGTNQILP